MTGRAEMAIIRQTYSVLGRHCVTSHGTGLTFRGRKYSVITNSTASLLLGRRVTPVELLQTPPLSQVPVVSRAALLQNVQVLDDNELCERRFSRKFEPYVIGEALYEEEYWTAASLRAESLCEDRSNDRYVDSFRREFAEKEFRALKRRCSGINHQESCTCIVVLKVDECSKQQVEATVVGTLDVIFRYPSNEGNKLNFTCWPSCISSRAEPEPIYAYVSNLCVAKSERRKGLATNLLSSAIETAHSKGAEEIFVHVHGDNRPAKHLYQSIGFQMVGKPPNPFLCDGDNHLLSYKFQSSHL